MKEWREPRLRLTISPGLGEKSRKRRTRERGLKVVYSAIEDHERELCLRMIRGLTDIDGLKIWGITDPERITERSPPYLSLILR